MAGALTDYLEKAILDHTLAGVPYTPPAAHYVALLTATPADSGAPSNEVVGGSYQRALAQFNASTIGATTTTTNSNTLAYSAMPAVTVAAIAIYDQTTAGNMLYYGALSAAVAVTAGGTFVINSGGLTVSLD